jgi:hypothetical protein
MKNNKDNRSDVNKESLSFTVTFEIPIQIIESLTKLVLQTIDREAITEKVTLKTKSTEKDYERDHEQPVKFRYRQLNDLPEVLSAQHIADYLGIARNTVYSLFRVNPKHGGIPNFDVGAPGNQASQSTKTSKRVMKSDFINWIGTQKQERKTRFID